MYGLEEGVIKQFQSGIQMKNLVCDLRTQGNENVCFSCDVEIPSKQVLDPFCRDTVSVEGGKSYIEVMVLSGSGQMSKCLTQNTVAIYLSSC